MNTKIINKKRGISPIIATLLLILIAIAAGVVVYAYVIGFVGNSTGNSGATTDTLSIDQLALSSKTASFPVTAFVRNEGPSTESFNTGFFVKGSSLNDQLGPALTLSDSAGTFVVTDIGLSQSGSTSLVVTLTATCTSSGTLTINVLGFSSTAITCVSAVVTGNPATITLSGGITVSTTPAFTADTGSYAGVTVSSTAVVFGTVITAGTINLAINSVAQFTLATKGGNPTNPLSAGQTYTVQVTGTDGGSTAASGKAT